ncbi:MAG: sigma-70 family RNA polymerase sigma factor [Verrucomicrobiales bacterium]|nr:sigma-70 family RNA polymerase sigma factor [Verrucomicrobiales bacterium]
MSDSETNSMQNEPPQRDSGEDFIRLLSEHEKKITLYVMNLVRDRGDAEDIIQETKLVMWRHFHKFELGSNFIAWARKIAFHQVLTYRRKHKRRAELSDAFLESVAYEISKNEDSYDLRSDALKSCVGKLSRPHRQILLMRYTRDMEVGEIGEEVGRSEGAVYRLLSRIRMMLQDCVTKEMGKVAV